MILMIVSGIMFLAGGYTWLKVVNAFRSRERQNHTLVEAELVGIVIGFAFVGAGVAFLLFGLHSMATPKI